jgi:hypothetical protein
MSAWLVVAICFILRRITLYPFGTRFKSDAQLPMTGFMGFIGFLGSG